MYCSCELNWYITASHVISSHAYVLYYHFYISRSWKWQQKSQRQEQWVRQAGMSIQTDQQMTTGVSSNGRLRLDVLYRRGQRRGGHAKAWSSRRPAARWPRRNMTRPREGPRWRGPGGGVQEHSRAEKSEEKSWLSRVIDGGRDPRA
jgi:hypothetical protein